MSKNFFFIVAIVVMVVLLSFFPYRLCLVVTDDAGRDVLSKKVGPGDVFSIKFTHSVEKVEVVDTFLVTEAGQMLLRNTSAGSSGAGLPSGVEDNATVKDGLLVVEDINRTFDRINMVTGSIPRHRLALGGVEYSLLNLAGDERSFCISLKRKSLADSFIS